MAKGKGKRSSGADTIIPDGGVAVNDSNAGADSVPPQLEEGAFAGLRQRIEQKLKNENAAKEQKSLKNKPKGGSKDDPKKDTPKKDTPKKETAPKPAPTQQSKKDNVDKTKGKKRDRNGDVIAKEENPSGKDKPSNSSGADENDTLRREILALGGTEEDLDLIAGVGSESEVEDKADVPKKSGKSSEDALRKELSGMLATAGQVVPDDLEDEEAGDDEGEEEEEEEEDGDDGDDESDEQDDAEQEISDVEEETPPARATKANKEPLKETKKEPTKPEDFIPKEYSNLSVPPRADWYAIPLSGIPEATKQTNMLPRHLIDRVHTYAISLLEKDSLEYNKAQQATASSSHRFYSTIMTSGTLSDKVSALTLAVQESPVHSTKALESLINLGKKPSRAQVVEVLRSLKDMFAQGTLLPNDRRLRSFGNQPSLMAAFHGQSSHWNEKHPLPEGIKDRHLILWAFEHFLKDQFFEFLKILEVWCSDEIEFSRSRALSYVYELLKEKPEQEANLLRLLVNKLGDPSKKIASRASYLLLQLEQAHPMMKMTVVKAVEEVLFRSGQSKHAKYYGIITLNQTVLSLKEENIGIQLLDIYFSLFVALLKPGKNGKRVKGQPNPGPPGKKLNRKAKAREAEAAKGFAQDEEMREKLISAILTGVNRAYPFTSSNTERLSKHIDTLFHITHSSNFNTSIQALMLIQQLTSSHQVGADRFYRTLYESLLDPRVATSSKQALYLNLLFRALKNDVNVRRVKAFVKRLVQILGLHQPNFICGIFCLIRELEKTYSGLQTLLDQPEENESDEEEVFRDVPDEDDEPQEQTPVVKPQKPWNGYDPRKRDPEHSNAEKTCLWELVPYLSHFHPSVSVNATHLLDHETMSGKPDLTLHTLSHFLDRFIYRTPKAAQGARGSSIMQPLAGGEASDRLVVSGQPTAHVPLNSETFWKKKAEDVSAEDVFFHEYFSRVGKDKDRARAKKDAKDPVEKGEEADDLSDAESEIWKALVDSRPELEEEGSDDDLDMDDLESAYDAEEQADDLGEGEGEGSDDEVIFNDESDDEGLEELEAPKTKAKATNASKKKEPEPPSDDEDDFDMDVSDDGAFIGSDEELPSDMEAFDDDEPEQEKPKEQSENGKKRRKLKQLPMFASADDYAALLDGEDEGM